MIHTLNTVAQISDHSNRSLVLIARVEGEKNEIAFLFSSKANAKGKETNVT